jgi:hypothetical protein
MPAAQRGRCLGNDLIRWRHGASMLFEYTTSVPLGNYALEGAVAAPLRGSPPAEYVGRCRRCQREHRLPNDAALGLAALQQLFDQLSDDPALAPERMALEASPGKMIGVLVTDSGVLRAYSGELGGRRDWPRWVGPVLRREDTAELEAQTLARIAELDAAMGGIDVPASQRRLDEARVTFRRDPEQLERVRQRLLADRSRLAELRRERRAASQRLSEAMFQAAAVTNARGERLSLRDVFVGDRIAGGTTDCCVPKLLEAANVGRQRPRALAEAWWGPTLNGRHHGDLQAPCERKCQPVLGHLLCGWDDL